MPSRAPLWRQLSSPRRPLWRPRRPRERASRRAPARPRWPQLRHREATDEKIRPARVVRRDDHPHPDPRLVEQLFRKSEWHPHAAVRGGIAGQRPAMQRDAVPGDALHVRHRGIVIQGRVVVLVLLQDGEDAGRRLASLGAGRHRRAKDPAVGVVERDLLALDRHDRHDRLAGLARRRRLGGCAGGLSRRGLGGQRRQGGHRRERHNSGRAQRRTSRWIASS